MRQSGKEVEEDSCYQEAEKLVKTIENLILSDLSGKRTALSADTYM